MSIEITSKQIEAAFQASQASAPVSDRLVGKFQDLMQQPNMAQPVQNDAGGPNVVSTLIAAQDVELQQTVSDALTLEQQAPSLSENQMTAATIHMTLELASTQLDMEAKMGVVNSSKTAVETLMKNQ
jgi:type III secretion inner rod protein HrpB2